MNISIPSTPREDCLFLQTSEKNWAKRFMSPSVLSMRWRYIQRKLGVKRGKVQCFAFCAGTPYSPFIRKCGKVYAGCAGTYFDPAEAACLCEPEEAMVLGVSNHAEIWDKAEWAKVSEIEMDPASLEAAMDELNF